MKCHMAGQKKKKVKAHKKITNDIILKACTEF